MSGLQILDGAGTAEIEEIGARSSVASTAALSLADVSEAMLHDDTLT